MCFVRRPDMVYEVEFNNIGSKTHGYSYQRIISPISTNKTPRTFNMRVYLWQISLPSRCVSHDDNYWQRMPITPWLLKVKSLNILYVMNIHRCDCSSSQECDIPTTNGSCYEIAKELHASTIFLKTKKWAKQNTSNIFYNWCILEREKPQIWSSIFV